MEQTEIKTSNSQFILTTVAGSFCEDIRKTSTFKDVLGGGTVRKAFKNSYPGKL
jgi:hypothetical protein